MFSIPSEAVMLGLLVAVTTVSVAVATGWIRQRRADNRSVEDRDIQIAVLSKEVELLQKQVDSISKKVDQIWRCIPWKARRDNES